MKKIIFLLLTLLILSCDNYLDRKTLDKPTSEVFLSSKEEVDGAMNNAYRVFYWDSLYDMFLDGATDDVWIRSFGGNIQNVGNGKHNTNTAVFSSTWTHYYKYIERSNYIINNIDRAGLTPEEKNKYLGEAKFIRAYAYMYLTELFGNVPYTDKVLTNKDEPLSSTDKGDIVPKILEDLEDAMMLTKSDTGRISKWAALALKARVSLYNGRYLEAANAAKEIIEKGEYVLYPDYKKLFTYEGSHSSEVILDVGFNILVNSHALPQYMGGRRIGSWSIIEPTTFLVDSYECTDGKTIDESPLFDKTKPYENRDPRLKASIVTPGDLYFGANFETHPDSTVIAKRKSDGSLERDESNNVVKIGNPDVTNPYATFTGYLFWKYLDADDLSKLGQSTLSFMLIRYAEVLLTYAEAKIELGDIDNSVLDAINKVRERAYNGSGITYPAVTTTDVDELRTIVRRERRIELAGEGFRLFDIRRWKIAEKVLNNSVFPGRKQKDKWYDPDIPTFINGYPEYEHLTKDEVYNKKLEERVFVAPKDYLWPIPQVEKNINHNIEQNSGY